MIPDDGAPVISSMIPVIPVITTRHPHFPSPRFWWWVHGGGVTDVARAAAAALQFLYL